jgi:hypothetical protein
MAAGASSAAGGGVGWTVISFISFFFSKLHPTISIAGSMTGTATARKILFRHIMTPLFDVLGLHQLPFLIKRFV